MRQDWIRDQAQMPDPFSGMTEARWRNQLVRPVVGLLDKEPRAADASVRSPSIHSFPPFLLPGEYWPVRPERTLKGLEYCYASLH